MHNINDMAILFINPQTNIYSEMHKYLCTSQIISIGHTNHKCPRYSIATFIHPYGVDKENNKPYDGLYHQNLENIFEMMYCVLLKQIRKSHNSSCKKTGKRNKCITLESLCVYLYIYILFQVIGNILVHIYKSKRRQNYFFLNFLILIFYNFIS